MALFEGRILITDGSNKDDRDAVIANILNHKSSRATLYVMVKDFEDIHGVRAKFPSVIPFVLIPDESIDLTRRILKLLPHMEHFINFLGQDLALELLNKRCDFRIKSVSKAYARSSVIPKILSSNGQGIIFNVDTGDNYCKDNVVAAGIAAKNTIKGGVKKVFFGRAGPSSTDECEPLMQNEDKSHDSENALQSGTANNSSSNSNSCWHFIVSLYYSLCPCVNDARVIIPTTEYPPDLDATLMQTFTELYATLEADWFQKQVDLRHLKENAVKKLQNSKEERVEKEYKRLMGGNSDDLSTGSNRHQAFVNVRNGIRMEKEKIDQEYNQKTSLLYRQHYRVIVEAQIEMLISFWKKMRLTPLM